MAGLFDSMDIRGVRLKNRIVVSPMCQYSAIDGMPNDWHLVHLGSRAVGGASLVLAEATAVQADGRISPEDTGIYDESHVEAWARITRFIVEQGSVPGIQLAHAGRKASTAPPWKGGKPVGEDQGGWSPIWSASALPFADDYQTPLALDSDGIRAAVLAFRTAAERSLRAGFRVIEIHAAHGYLLHQFLSPLSNRRSDAYGGSFDNRTRIVLETVEAVRSVWPGDNPLFVRLSATDWVQGGWDLQQSVELARILSSREVDVIDCSSGGAVPGAKIPIGPGYQVPFAESIRREAEIPTAAVGLITDPIQAAAILESGQADLIVLARELLRDPYWPRRAAKELGVELEPPPQYARAW